MEKIIAVVVMIAIVIGLIATAVMPMVSQMNDQGANANNQLGMLTATMSGDQISGATLKVNVVSDYSKTKLDADNKLATLKIDGTDMAAKTLADVKAWLNTNVNDAAIYTKKETGFNANGSVKDIEYNKVG